MATERRPARPTTRVTPLGAPPKPPTGRVPAVSSRPQTSRLPVAPPAPAARPAAAPPHRPATGSVARNPAPKRGTTRVGIPAAAGRAARPAAPPKKNNALLIGGIVGGVVLIIVLAAVLAGGGDSKKHDPPASSKKDSSKKSTNYAQLERDGMAKCDQGVKAIQNAYNVSDKEGLRRGISLIGEGNDLLNKAKDLGSPGVETNQYQNALYLARKKLMELK